LGGNKMCLARDKYFHEKLINCCKVRKEDDYDDDDDDDDDM
jgi:hypothetical protein